MKYSQQFKSGNVVIPAALLFHYKEIFSSTDDFLVWQFCFYQNTSHFEELTPSVIAEAVGRTVAEVSQSITNLQAAGLLESKTIDLAGEIEVIFDALPALEKLDSLLLSEEKAPETSDSISNPAKNLVADFERELGRFLSPFEIEEIQKSLQDDQTSPDLIREALKQAVLNGKTNWRYIQTILKNWRREGITTVAQVEAKNAEFEAQKNPKPQTTRDYSGAMELWKD